MTEKQKPDDEILEFFSEFTNQLNETKIEILDNQMKTDEIKNKFSKIEKVEIRPISNKGLFISGDPGSWAAIRPVADEYEKKTFLGIFLGHFPISHLCHILNETTLVVDTQNNPAIYVPDLKKIIYGIESWWGILNGPDDLRQISDVDIQNIWYVKALKDLTNK